MRACIWLFATGLLLPQLGCTAMDHPDEAVFISWIEARRVPGGVAVRAVGGGGCWDQVRGIDDDIAVLGDTLVVTLYARGFPWGGDCFRPGQFDTTVLIALDERRPIVFLSPSGAFRSWNQVRPLLHLKSESQSEPERWLGGFVMVREDSLGCRYMYHRRALEYAFRPLDGITLAPGTNAYVRGLLLAPADTGCGGRALVSVDSIVLTSKAGPAPQRGPI